MRVDDQWLQQHLSWLKPLEKPAYPPELKPQRLAAGLVSVKRVPYTPQDPRLKL